jgi:tRNA dimethylallyltransferase
LMEPIPNSKFRTPNSYVVCGPTASGKSELSDVLAERLTERCGRRVPTVVVDSMQVYRELPIITNQARRRTAGLVGIVSVSEEWSVAAHRACVGELASSEDVFVLDAGTGMYLNAILLDFPLAPKVPPELRRRAGEVSANAPNPRRAARERELELAGADTRGSVWEGNLRYDTSIVYLRPPRDVLDAAISGRSRRIAQSGLGEAETLRAMLARGEKINPSVKDSVGVRELLQHLSGEITLDQAEDLIATRTRRLARRQIRWFDKLTRTLQGRASIIILEDPGKAEMHSMHDIIGA